MKDLKRIADALESIANSLVLIREDQKKSMEMARRAVERGEENASRLMNQFNGLLLGGGGNHEL